MNELALGAASIAVPYLATYLQEALKGGAKKLGEEGAGATIKLLGWLRDKLTGRAKEALDDLEKDPSSADNQADLRKQLAKFLDENPGLLADLQALIPTKPDAGVSVTQTVGDNSKAGQAVGDQNSISIT